MRAALALLAVLACLPPLASGGLAAAPPNRETAHVLRPGARRLAAFADVGPGEGVLSTTDSAAGVHAAANLTFHANTTIPRAATLTLRLSASFCDQLQVSDRLLSPGALALDGGVSVSASLSAVSFVRAGDGKELPAGTNVTLPFGLLTNPWPLGLPLDSVLDVFDGDGARLSRMPVAGFEVTEHTTSYVGGSGRMRNASKWDAGEAPESRSVAVVPASDEAVDVVVDDDVQSAGWTLQGPNPVAAHVVRLQPSSVAAYAPTVVSLAGEVPLCSLRLRPTITPVNNLQGIVGRGIGPVEFTVTDGDTRLDLLEVSLLSSDEDVVRDRDMTYNATDAEARSFSMRPRGPGIASAELRVFDAHKAASALFTVTVGDVGAVNVTFADRDVGDLVPGAAPRVRINVAYELLVWTPPSVGPTRVLVSRERALGGCFLDASATGFFDAEALEVTLAHGDERASSLWLTCTEIQLNATALLAIQTYGVNELRNFTDTRPRLAVVDVPDQLSNVEIAAGDTEVTLSWTTGFDGGLEITEYLVTASDGSEFLFDPAAVPPAAVTGLLNGVQLKFTVAARNDVGWSDASDVSDLVVPQGPLTVTLGDVNVVVGVPVAIQVSAIATPRQGALEIGLDPDGSMAVVAAMTMDSGALVAAGTFVAEERGSLLAVTLSLGGVSELEYAVPDPQYVNAECADRYDGTDCSTCAAGAYRVDAQAACLACPDNAACAGGDEVPVPAAGYYSASPGEILECSPASACVGGYGDGNCAAGYTAARCSECDLNFYRATGECIACPAVSVAVVVGGIILVLIFMTMLAAAMLAVMEMVVQMPELSLAFPVVAMAIDYCQVVSLLAQSDIWPYSISVALRWFTLFRFNIDVLSAECAGIDYSARWALVQLTPVLLTVMLLVFLFFVQLRRLFLFVLRGVGLLLWPFHCAATRVWGALPGWARRVPVLLLFPILDPNCIPRQLLRVSWAVVGRPINKARRGIARAVRNQDKIIGLWVEFMQIVYIGVTSKTLEIFDCVRQPDGTAVMEAQPSAYCVGPPFGEAPGDDVPEINKVVHRTLLPWATLSLVVYTVGMPLAAWWVLRHVNVVPDADLLEASDFGEYHRGDMARAVRQFERYGRMFTRYRVKTREERAAAKAAAASGLVGENAGSVSHVEWPRYWAVVLMVKKCMLVILTSMFTSNPPMQFSSMCFIVVMAWMFSVRVRPYVDSRTLMLRERSHRSLARLKMQALHSGREVAPLPLPPAAEDGGDGELKADELRMLTPTRPVVVSAGAAQAASSKNVNIIAAKLATRARAKVRHKHIESASEKAVARLRLNMMESVLHGCVFLVILAALLFYSSSWSSAWEEALVTVVVLGLLVGSGVVVVASLFMPMFAVWRPAAAEHPHIQKLGRALKRIVPGPLRRKNKKKKKQKRTRPRQVRPAPVDVVKVEQPGAVEGPPLRVKNKMVVPVDARRVYPAPQGATSGASPRRWGKRPPAAVHPAPPRLPPLDQVTGPAVADEQLSRFREAAGTEQYPWLRSPSVAGAPPVADGPPLEVLLASAAAAADHHDSDTSSSGEEKSGGERTSVMVAPSVSADPTDKVAGKSRPMQGPARGGGRVRVSPARRSASRPASPASAAGASAGEAKEAEEK